MDTLLKRLAQCRWCGRVSSSTIPRSPARFSTSHGRRSMLRSLDVSDTGFDYNHGEFREIDLETEYDRVLRSIVKDNISQLRPLYITKELLQSDHARDTIISNDEHEDSFNDLRASDGEIGIILRSAAKQLNSSYHKTKGERMLVPRIPCAPNIYSKFLRSLYGHLVGGRHRMTSQDLYEAYQSLPFPPPLHIQPQHLEDLLSLLMSSGWDKSFGNLNDAQTANIFLNVLSDLHASSMPVSVREYNSAMNMTAQMDLGSPENTIPFIEEKYNLVKESTGKLADVSTLNMLMSLGISGDPKQGLFEQALKGFHEYNLRPDRFTLMIYMRERSKNRDVDGVRSVYQDFLSSGFAIDMNVKNLVMQSLLISGDTSTALSIYQSLLQGNLRLGPDQPFSKPRLMRKLALMDHFQSLRPNDDTKHEYFLPTIPDLTTFAMFFNHFCMKGSFEEAIEVLQTMKHRNCPPTRHQFYRLINSFALHSNGAKQHEWQLRRFKFVLALLNEFQEELVGRQDYFTYIMGENAIRAYGKLSKSTKLTNLYDILKRRDFSRAHSVHTVLQKLIDM